MNKDEHNRSHAGFMERLNERHTEPDGRPAVSFTYKNLDFAMAVNPPDFIVKNAARPPQ